MAMRQFAGGAAVLLIGLFAVGGCGDDDDDGPHEPDGSPDNAGQTCAGPDDCYPDVDHSTLKGAVECVTQLNDGYCTHLCTADTDCCAVEGECTTDLKQVCSPLESLDAKRCYLSCEDGHVPAGMHEQEYCQHHMGTRWNCVSSGGGNENRKICAPSDCQEGESCGVDADCATGLVCLTDFRGGYCGRRDCTLNADCGPNALCTRIGDANYCLKRCTTEWDCRLCRPGDLAATCRNDVTFVEGGTTGSVCDPPR